MTTERTYEVIERGVVVASITISLRGMRPAGATADRWRWSFSFEAGPVEVASSSVYGTSEAALAVATPLAIAAMGAR